ncbi:hypothetical protein SCLCIDRAFT_1215773 [Scleroderma citrinum Foug A]|uniref:Uncharacterized protein n=1 Tax=Scleroderma citrinum Foug A TaxID=1036808 RepID=A0A0C3E0R8_9AGAM|nr:hypothetical protein SCLCIDRAFT_1215773 [Scleroderma citrinum Foug A]
MYRTHIRTIPKQLVGQDTVPVYRFEHDGSMERMWDVHSNTFVGLMLSMTFYLRKPVGRTRFGEHSRPWELGRWNGEYRRGEQ